MNVFVVDVGTSSIRGMLINETGESLFTHQIPYSFISEEGGKAEQDSAFWKQALNEVLMNGAAFLKKSQQTASAVAYTSLRSATLAVDENGLPLTPTIMWQDTRNADIISSLAPKHEDIRQKTGVRPNTVYSGSKMALIRQLWPQAAQNTHKFLTIGDYIGHLLCGEFASDETYGGRSMMMNLRTRQWDAELVDLFGAKLGQLCGLVAPGTQIGFTSQSLHKETGFLQGIPVYTAGGDQQCSALGQTGGKVGQVSITLGTGAFSLVHLGQLPSSFSNQVVFSTSAVPNVYVAEASMISCCSLYNWFCSSFYGADMALADEEIFSSPAGAGGCIFLPYFQGRATPDWNHATCGMVYGLCPATTRASMGRAVVEGIACEIANSLDCLRSGDVQVNTATVGGGLSKVNAFCQILADATGLAITRRRNPEATALGAWINTVVSMGVYPTRQAAFEMATSTLPETHFVPSEEKHVLYSKQRERMNHLYKQTMCNKEGKNEI